MKTAVLVTALVGGVWICGACEAPRPSNNTAAQKGDATPTATTPAAEPSREGSDLQRGTITVVVTAGATPVTDVQIAILTEDQLGLAMFMAGSAAPAEPRVAPLGKYSILASRTYPVTENVEWEFSGVKTVALTKPGELARVEFAVPHNETIAFRVEPPRNGGVGADFFEYADVAFDQPMDNSIFTEFQGDAFEVRARVPVGRTVRLPILPPGEYTGYIQYAVKRAFWTRTGNGPDDWLIPSVAAHGDKISLPATNSEIVLTPSLSEEDQETIRKLLGTPGR